MDAQNLGPHVLGQAAAHGRDDQRLLALAGGQRAPQQRGEGRVERCFGWLHAALADQLDFGRVAEDVRLDLGENLLDALRLDQPNVAFGEGLVRQHRLRAGAGVAAVQPVDRQRRPER